MPDPTESSENTDNLPPYEPDHEQTPDVDAEYKRLWEELDNSILGRSVGIWVDTGEPAYTQQEQQQMGVELTDTTKRKFVKLYHALPVNDEGTEHILLTPDGEILLVKVYLSGNASVEENKRSLYESAFSEQEIDLTITQIQVLNEVVAGKKLKNALQDARYWFAISSKSSIKSSFHPQQTEEVHQAFERSLTIAARRREQIARVEQESKEQTVKALKKLFGQPDENMQDPDS